METVVGLLVPLVRVVVGAVFVVDVLVVVPSVRVVLDAVGVFSECVVGTMVPPVGAALVIVVAVGHGAQVPFRGINMYCTVPVSPKGVGLQ